MPDHLSGLILHLSCYALLVTAAVSIIKADVIMLAASREDERKCPRHSATKQGYMLTMRRMKE